MMKVVVNGFIEEVPDDSTVNDLIDRFEEQDHDLIVEVNGRYVYAADYRTLKVEDGDTVELIHPAFGG